MIVTRLLVDHRGTHRALGILNTLVSSFRLMWPLLGVYSMHSVHSNLHSVSHSPLQNVNAGLYLRRNQKLHSQLDLHSELPWPVRSSFIMEVV